MSIYRERNCGRRRDEHLGLCFEAGIPSGVDRVSCGEMRKLVLALVVILAAVGWQTGCVYVQNYEFGSDLRELAAQNEARSGLESVSTEDELKDAVMASAHQHGIQLAPDHLMVHRTLTPATFAPNGMLEVPAVLGVSIATEYSAPVNLLGLSFNLHFAPACSHSAPMIAK